MGCGIQSLEDNTMRITAEFTNKTARLGMGQSITVETDGADFETIFRRLMYTYGQVISTRDLTPEVREYILVAKMQYPDTRESYEMETLLTVEKTRR